MAKPSTRQGLIDYCLRQLGAPVLEINVDDDQIDDLIDDAIQYFQERHFDGIERMLLKHKVTKENIQSCADYIFHKTPFDNTTFSKGEQVMSNCYNDIYWTNYE